MDNVIAGTGAGTNHLQCSAGALTRLGVDGGRRDLDRRKERLRKCNW